MRIGLVSDLHLEFHNGREHKQLLEKINEALCDIIVIAGDTHPHPDTRDAFFELITKPTFVIMGNHDYYNGIWYDDFKETKFMVGGCLWTDFANDPAVESLAERGITDFRRIKDWTAQRVKTVHKNHAHRIFESDKRIVVTHFPPSEQCVMERYKGDPFNGYFVNRLDDHILASDKKLWLCGHTHASFDFFIGNCRVIANPLGYPREVYETVGHYEVKVIETIL